MALVVPNATFSDAECADLGGDDGGVSISSEITMPLFRLNRKYGDNARAQGYSVHSIVEGYMVEAVSSGECIGHPFTCIRGWSSLLSDYTYLQDAS